jgi:hypothetical protein
VNVEIGPVAAGYGHPDWVMCGVPWNGGVRLLASKEMTHAELDAQRDLPDIDPWGSWPKMLPPLRIKLTAGMKTFTMIEAPDYPSAFRALFEHWTPGPDEHAAIGGIPAIGAAP